MMGKKYIDQEALLADMESRLRSLERNECPEGAEDFAAGVRRGFRMGMNYVSSCEAVDAVEAVRCRECKRSSGVSPIRTCSRGCGIHNPYGNSFVNDTDYCAWGQRREEEHNAVD